MDFDKVVESLLGAGIKHEEYLKQTHLCMMKGYASKPTVGNMLMLCLTESLIAFMMKSKTLTLEDVFRLVPEDLRSKALEDFKVSEPYEKYLKDRFFDQDGNSVFLVKGWQSIAHMVDCLSVIKHKANVFSGFLHQTLQKAIDKDPASSEYGFTIDEVMEMRIDAIENGVDQCLLVDGEDEEERQQLFVWAGALCFLKAYDKELQKDLTPEGDEERLKNATKRAELYRDLRESNDLVCNDAGVILYIQKAVKVILDGYDLSSKTRFGGATVMLNDREYSFTAAELLTPWEPYVNPQVTPWSSVESRSEAMFDSVPYPTQDFDSIARQAAAMDARATHLLPMHARLC